MKSWFTKLRISAALDAGHKLSASLRRNIGSSEQLRGVEEEMTALDCALKQASPRPQAPPGLHRSIMQAVRVAERPQAAPGGLAFLRRVAAPLVAALALVAVWQTLRGPVAPPTQGTQSLAAATTALEMSGQLAQTVPSAVVAPLSDELARLNRDLDNTAQFILASLP
jgi:hypothetical protein